MGGGSTTEVTNTGLGDDQYQQLADNQAGLGTSIDNFNASATTSMDSANTSLDTANTNLDTANAGITGLTAGQLALTSGQTALTEGQAGLSTALGNQGKAMTDKFGNVIKGQQSLTDALTKQGQTLGQGQTAIGKQVDTVNTNVGGLQTSVDQGFTDTLQGQADLGTQVSSGFDTAGNQLSTGLGSATDEINTALSGTQTAIQGSVQDNANSLSTLSGNVDAYSTQTLQNQGELAAGQEQYTTKFDDYIDKYSDDTILADQTRADIQTGQGNAAEASRLQIANLADAQATGQVNLQTAATDAANKQGNAIEAGFTGLADANATGIDAVQTAVGDMGMEQQQAQQNLITDLGGIREGLATGLQGLDENTKQQYKGMIDSFDSQGNLIANSIDAQGNTLSREMDAQGNVLTTTLDAQGVALGTTSTNVNTMIANAKEYQKQTQLGITDTQGLMADQGKAITGAVEGGFSAVTADQAQRSKQMSEEMTGAFDASGQLITSAVDAQGNTLSRELDAQGNVLTTTLDAQGVVLGSTSMSLDQMRTDATNYQKQTDTYNADNQGLMSSLTDQTTAGFKAARDVMGAGFDAATGVMGVMGKEILGIGTSLDGQQMGLKQQYADLNSAFDASGQLIASAVDAQGNTLSREMDAQGNLLTSTLDAQGNVINSTSTNIEEVMASAKLNYDAVKGRDRQASAQLKTVAGSMTEQADVLKRQNESVQGLMADQTNQFTQDLSALNTNITNQGQLNTNAIQQGFDGQSGTLDAQTRDLAKVASMQGDLNQQQRQTYNSLSSSFDDQGALISNSIDNQGNTISRALDDQGNLLLRKFDTQGRAMGDQAVNIARTLQDLSQLKQQTGANAGMGGLTQANKAGMAQSGGFASPYTIT